MKQIFIPARPRCGQEQYYNSIRDNDITFCTGHAGTGKTFLAISAAVEYLYDRKSPIKRVVIIRPYIPSNTGEKLGALPGDLREKVLPYAEGVRDNLRELMSNQGEISRLINNQFEFTVLSLCRGRSFNNCFIIVEEAQNVPLNGDGMKMLLTRLGHNSKLVIAGDLDQCDIPSENSGLAEAMNALADMKGVGIVEMYQNVYRNPMIKEILERYVKFRNNGYL